MGKIDPLARKRIDDATLRQLVGYNLKRLFNLVKSDLAQTLQPFGLRMLTYTALVLIRDNPGLKQSDLARAMDVERSNMVAILDELENLGLIRRDRVPQDRRSYALLVTETGAATCGQAVEAVLAHETMLFAAPFSDKLDALLNSLENLRNATTDGGKLDR